MIENDKQKKIRFYKSKIIGVTRKGRIVHEQLHERSWKDRNLIDIFPDCHFLGKLYKPCWSVGLRGYILNSSLRALIHEMLHKSGMHNEEVRKTTEYFYKEFRRKHLNPVSYTHLTLPTN